jgi:hypothetical protein
MGILIYRLVLALAAAGIGAVIPGMIDVDIHPAIRAGGAIALFVIVYWFKPADLVASPPKADVTPPSRLPNGTPFPADKREVFLRVWRSLTVLEKAGQDLWNQVSDQTLSAFADCLGEAKECIAENGVFFSPLDYIALQDIMKAANFYLGGKVHLSNIRNGVVTGEEMIRLAPPGEQSRFVDSAVQQQIRENKRWLTRYRNLLTKIRSSLHREIAA